MAQSRGALYNGASLGFLFIPVKSFKSDITVMIVMLPMLWSDDEKKRRLRRKSHGRSVSYKWMDWIDGWVDWKSPGGVK